MSSIFSTSSSLIFAGRCVRSVLSGSNLQLHWNCHAFNSIMNVGSWFNSSYSYCNSISCSFHPSWKDTYILEKIHSFYISSNLNAAKSIILYVERVKCMFNMLLKTEWVWSQNKFNPMHTVKCYDSVSAS